MNGSIATTPTSVIESAWRDRVRASLNNVPRLAIGNFPTPVQPIALDGGREFWVKDDGKCSDTYGGNKVRKLEYLLAEIQRREKKTLVVHGDVESHTVQACSIWGRKMGLNVHAIVFPHKNQPLDLPELSRLRSVGARIHVRKTMLTAVLQAQWIGWRRQGFVVPLGATTPAATLGYVQAALELREQIHAGLLPTPRRIYLPFATGGSVAGLLIGLTLADLRTRVVAVQTVENFIANPGCLRRLIQKTLALLGEGDGCFSECWSRLELVDKANLGAGYRDVPPNVSQAVAIAEMHGLRLEPVFSGKALAALLSAAPDFPKGELLFWNTHDQHGAINREDA